LAVSYRATWSLPGLDFHQQAGRSLAGRDIINGENERSHGELPRKQVTAKMQRMQSFGKRFQKS
ncbi:MAG: hypothetical protein AB1556_01595, partial [Bacillota bacterium]